jgi:aspartate kinase
VSKERLASRCTDSCAFPVTVVKVGGSLLRSAPDLERAAAFVARRRREGESMLVVVSALWGVTDQLDRLAWLAADPSTNGACGRAVEKLRQQHEAVAQWIGGGSQSALLVEAIHALLADVTTLVDGIRRCGVFPEWTYTRIMSSGERLAAHLMAAAIRCAGADARAITAEDLGLRARGPARNGTCDLAGSAAGFREIRPELRRRVLVLTGFYGLASEGRVVLFGRGGSDDTGSASAAALEAETLELWKDVPGCMSSDPKIIAGARPVPELSFNEAEMLGGYGCPLVHSTCLEVLRNRPIRVEIGLPEGLGGRCTRLVQQRSGPAGVTVLVAQKEPPRVAAVGEGIVSATALVEQMRESLARSQIRGPLTPRFSGTAGVSFDVDSDERVAALTCLHDTFFPPPPTEGQIA